MYLSPWQPAVVLALAWDGANVIAGGSFTAAGGLAANNIAKWDGTAWSRLGSGVEGGGIPDPWWGPWASVNALAWDGTALFAGGDFMLAGGAAANYIAKWDGSSWCALGEGTDYAVGALASAGADLYVGGWFPGAGGVSAKNIARWDGAEWSPLGSGLNAMGNALAWDGVSLFAGGEFSTAGGKVSGAVARWHPCRLPSRPETIGPVADADPCADTGVLLNWPKDVVDWGDGGMGMRAYDVLRDELVIAADIPNGTTQYLDTTGADGVAYLYEIRYRNGCYKSILSGGVYAADNPGPNPTVIGPIPACGAELLGTQAYSTYQWYRNGSPIPGAVDQTFDAAVTGTYAVCITDSAGCQSTSPGFVVSPLPETPVISGPGTGCATTGVELSTGAFESYQWIRDGVDIPFATTKIYHAMKSGTYRVRVAGAGGCEAASAGYAVSIGPEPVILGKHQNGCPEVGVHLSSGSFTGYQWYFNGAAISSATAQAYQAGVTGNYSVRVSDGCGCEGESEPFFVFVDFCPASEVSPSTAIFPLLLVKSPVSGTGYHLYFQRVDTVDGFNVYEGILIFPWDGQYHHGGQPGNVCNATAIDLGTGEMMAELAPSDGDHYYLVTAFGGGIEGPSGFDSSPSEIPPSQNACAP